MPALPYNSTALYTVEYNNGLDNHSLTVRYDENAVTVGDARVSVEGFFLAIEDGLYADFVYVSARNQARGASFSLPAAVPNVAPNPGGPPITDGESPVSHTFIGRSQGGRRCSLELYALNLPFPSDYLFVRGENPVIDAGLDYLQGQGAQIAVPGTFISIDGLETTWYDRVTSNYNDYWIRQARR